MSGLFDWQRITSVPFEDEVFGLAATIFLVVFLAGFITAAALYWRAPARYVTNGLQRRLSQWFATIFLWVFGVGLVFFLFRVMGLPFLGIRLWLYAMTLVLLGAIGYIGYYLRTRYPGDLAAYQAQQVKRRYQQGGRRRPAAASSTGRPNAAAGTADVATSLDSTPAENSKRAAKRRQRGTARTR